ncbi:C39 family peptidase [Luteimonas changyuni]|uniref:C39 family peptidase n=1 Tax=Luteimonas sp. MJ145 TaxID=3129234 RepID=UPI0031BAFD82
MTRAGAASGLWLAVACIVGLAVLPGAALAGRAEVRVPYGGSYSMQVTSLKAARYRTTIPQQYDYSCGSASVATLLTFQYGQSVGEADVFRHMYERGDQARIRREGFSMLDMRAYLQAQGYAADGFEVPLDRLLEEGLPAIVLLNDRGYRHFVVVKGMRHGRVLVGDPARGTRLLPRREFDRLWDNRVLFVVHNRRALAAFNHPRDWRLAPLAPLATAVQRQGLQDVVIRRRGPGDI